MASPRRVLIWAYLAFSPGKTAREIACGALGLRGAARNSGAVTELLERMEKDGQVTRQTEHSPQQGRPVSRWHAVPGAFAIAEESS